MSIRVTTGSRITNEIASVGLMMDACDRRTVCSSGGPHTAEGTRFQHRACRIRVPCYSIGLCHTL